MVSKNIILVRKQKNKSILLKLRTVEDAGPYNVRKIYPLSSNKNKNKSPLLKFFDPNFFTKKFGGVRGEALRNCVRGSGRSPEEQCKSVKFCGKGAFVKNE